MKSVIARFNGPKVAADADAFVDARVDHGALDVDSRGDQQLGGVVHGRPAAAAR